MEKEIIFFINKHFDISQLSNVWEAVNVKKEGEEAISTTSVAFSDNIATFISKEQIEQGKIITSEIIKNPNLLKQIKKNWNRARKGGVIEWEKIRKE
ncbi:MAG: hypothetical protein AB1410_02625 [Acidobacteriota bacterium]